MKDTLDFSKCPHPLIGVDEVGRGCLAGPVTAAAVMFSEGVTSSFYDDSKKIKEEQRELLAEEIQQIHRVGLGWATVQEIDTHNILQATFIAMHRALKALGVQSGTILIDGRDRIPKLDSFHQIPIIKGDQKVRLISAASIVAKVARDQFMKKLASEVGPYGFEKHKGYGTAYHRDQIQKMGPCVWHRQTFGGVKEFIKSSKISN